MKLRADNVWRWCVSAAFAGTGIGWRALSQGLMSPTLWLHLSPLAAYLHVVYTGKTIDLSQRGWRQAVPAAAVRGLIAVGLAWLLACTSVFRLKLKRWLRLGPHLEGDQRLLRGLQSGHPRRLRPLSYCRAGAIRLGRYATSPLASVDRRKIHERP